MKFETAHAKRAYEELTTVELPKALDSMKEVLKQKSTDPIMILANLTMMRLDIMGKILEVTSRIELEWTKYKDELHQKTLEAMKTNTTVQ